LYSCCTNGSGNFGGGGSGGIRGDIDMWEFRVVHMGCAAVAAGRCCSVGTVAVLVPGAGIWVSFEGEVK
jgi:hypothetical protein